MQKPLPRITPVSRPFWEGCNGSRLMLQQCDACREFIYYPRACCPHCGGGNLTWRETSGQGRIVSYTIIHRPHHESFFPETPYLFIAVKLEEGPLIFSRLDENPASADDLMQHPVAAVFVDHAPGQKLPFFRLV